MAYKGKGIRKIAALLYTALAVALAAGTAGCQTRSGENGSARSAGEGAASSSGSGETVTIYSARHYAADLVLYEAFTERTGIKVEEVKGTAEELVLRLSSEGEHTRADLFIAADGSVLQLAKQQGVLQPHGSSIVEANVPEQWRDPSGEWVAVTSRARIIAYAKDRVSPAELSTYEALAEERWSGKLLVRSSANLYNQTLLASMIEAIGDEASLEWAKGIVRNLARAPEGGDRSQAKAVAAGVGDLAVMNTYYIGQMSISLDEEDTQAFKKLGVFFPNQQSTGAHVNISGAGIARHAPNKGNAVKLLEFMTGAEGQSLLVEQSFEYPVNPQATMPVLLREWGTFKAQPYTFGDMARHTDDVARIFAQAGWE